MYDKERWCKRADMAGVIDAKGYPACYCANVPLMLDSIITETDPAWLGSQGAYVMNWSRDCT